MRKLYLAALSVALSGCATIWSGNSKEVDVEVPTGSVVEIAKAKSSAAVYRGGGGTVKLDTGFSYLVTVKAGDSNQEDMILPLDRRLDGATFLNLLWVLPIFWGVGVAVDMATGSFWTLPGELKFEAPPRAAVRRAPSSPVAAPATTEATEAGDGPPPTRRLTYDQLQEALTQVQAGHRDVALRLLGIPHSVSADTAHWWAPLPATGDCFVLKLSATKGNSLETAPAEKCARTPSTPY